MNTSFRKTQSQRAAAETGVVAAAHKQTNISDARKDIAAAEFAIERDERRGIRDQAMLLGSGSGSGSGSRSRSGSG